MKLELDKGIKNKVDIVGFVRVKEFKGQVTRISLSEVKKVVKLMELLDKNDFESVAIGVENDKPILFFLDEKKTMAYAIAQVYREGE